MLKREIPHSVIIIENKSNYATDQGNQLYRYWFNEMYIPNSDKHYSYTLNDKACYRLIYLSPDSNKLPDPFSLKKPDLAWLDEKYPELPDHLENKDLLIIHFNSEIVEWLESCLTLLDENNHRLREYLLQYILLWK